MPSDGTARLAIPINGVRLVDMAETRRFRELDRREAYYRKRQDAGKLYDWDGAFTGYGGDSPIKPGYVVPYAQRRPASRYDVATIVVTRFTSLLFGVDRFPNITVPGDSDAEDYAKALIKAARIPLRMIELRNLGGAVGTACASFAFVNGRPRVEAHNAKHCTVLRWADESERRPGAVLKTYVYARQVYDASAKRVREQRYFYARYWDEAREVIWEPIPFVLGESFSWVGARAAVSEHGFGFCPFYWAQNLPDSEHADGEGDYEGLEPHLDEINQLVSATTKGTKANVDPTLVVKMDPARNNGTVFKGSGNAIFSEGGAEYLELSGQGAAGAIAVLDKITQYAFDTACVVKPDPEKLSGTAQSAAALRLLYAPMLARADLLREQYGEFLIVPMIRDMMRAARLLISRNQAVILPDRVERELEEPEPRDPNAPPSPPGPPRPREEPTMRRVPRTPGTSEEIELNWNPYFPPTWDDITKGTTAVQAANGGKPVISQRTAVQAVSEFFGVTNIDSELVDIHEDSERAIDQAQRTMGPGPNPDLEGEDADGEDRSGEDDGA